MEIFREKTPLKEVRSILEKNQNIPLKNFTFFRHKRTSYKQEEFDNKKVK